MTQPTLLQTTALAAARHKPGFLYVLEMGLGKTLLTLLEALQYQREGLCTRLVVVAPNTFKSGWKREIEKHGLPCEVHVYRADRHSQAEKWVARGLLGRGHPEAFRAMPVLVVNYEGFRLKHFPKLLREFTEGRNVMLAVDESLSLKNPNSKRTKAIQKAVPDFAYVRLLSGKPTTQGPHDLFGQMRAIGAIRAGENYYSFRNRYVRWSSDPFPRAEGVNNVEDLRARLAPVAFLARKKEWLTELPDKSYTMREYTLDGVLAREYARMETDLLAYIDAHGEEIAVEATIALTKYGKLAQIHAGFVHDMEGQARWLVEDDDNPRLKVLHEILAEIPGKACVCYVHRAVGEQLAWALREHQPAMLRGGQTDAQILAQKDVFDQDPRCRVILLQVDAAMYGHTLLGDQRDTSTACHTMIFYQNSYSLNVRAQIEDRIHRIGQSNACLYIDLVGTEMDTRMVGALQRKERLYKALFGD